MAPFPMTLTVYLSNCR